MDMKLPPALDKALVFTHQHIQNEAITQFILHQAAEQQHVFARDPLRATFKKDITLNMALNYQNPEDRLAAYVPLLKEKLTQIAAGLVRKTTIDDDLNKDAAVNPALFGDAVKYMQSIVEDANEAEAAVNLFIHNCRYELQVLREDPRAREAALEWAKTHVPLDINLDALESTTPDQRVDATRELLKLKRSQTGQTRGESHTARLEQGWGNGNRRDGDSGRE